MRSAGFHSIGMMSAMIILLSTCSVHSLARPVAERVWAIGDLHGDAGCAFKWVERTGVVSNLSAPPEHWVWADDASQLVFMGDYIDRGPDARAVLVLVRELTRRFPEHVHALLGNHELNLLIDRARQPGGGRYLEYAYAAAHPAQYLAWVDNESSTEPAADELSPREVLRALHGALLRVYRDRRQLYAQAKVLMTPDGPRSIVHYVQPPEARARVASALRRWQAAYMRGISPRSELGSWLQRPLSVHLAGTLFVHGGLSEALLDTELPAAAPAQATAATPATAAASTRRLDSLEALAELNDRWLAVASSGRVGELAPVPGETTAEAEAAEALALAQSRELVEIASELVEYRGLHEAYAMRYHDGHSDAAAAGGGLSPAQIGCDRVDAVLRRLNASRIAVGHTPADSVRIRCGGRLLALDSTLSRNFRAHGNYYCDGGMEAEEPRICPPRREACEGQIVRLERANPAAAWMLHVVGIEWDHDEEEGGVEEVKVEL